MSGTVLWDVDTQVDFMLPGGKLHVPGAEQTAPAMGRLVAAARSAGLVHVASADDHELTDTEISDEPDFQTTYPPHCLRGTRGAAKVEETTQEDPVPIGLGEFPERFFRGREFLLLKKSFDVFTNPNTERLLDRLDPDEVILFGVATDVCDDAAILGLLDRGRRVRFVEDAARGLDEGRVAECTAAWRERGVEFTTVDPVLAGLTQQLQLSRRGADQLGIGAFLHSLGIAALTWLPLIFFGLIIYLLWRMLALMPRVKPTPIAPTSNQSVTWVEVAGLQEAKEEMQEVVDFLRDPGKFERLGARVPKGILLYGPPGTGKTLLAKAVANASGARFYSQSASAFVEMFAGLGASRIRKLFETARKHAPSIVFIDELDAVGAARTGHGFNREQDQTLNQLLVELDGFNTREQVVVMGASNRLQDLDPALLRPGRFDRQVLIAPPDLAGREEILTVHTRGKPLAADVDLSSIARQTAGLTGADLANIANEAAIFAGRAEQQYIRATDFDGAMERVVAGLQQRRVVTEKEKRILAYHEGGHALMSHLTGELLPVQKVTIVARGQALGYTLNLPSEERYLHTKEEFEDLLKVYLAGRAAEQVVFGRVTNGAANDLEKATELARAMVFEYGMSGVVTSRTMRADNYALSEETKRLRDNEQARLTDDAFHEALRLLEKHRPALDRVAHALLEKETLDRDELQVLLADLEPESTSSETVGIVRVVPLPTD